MENIIFIAEDTVNSCDELLEELLIRLNALYILHRTSHWQTHGITSYGDHLLFQRLYEPIVDEIDSLAERMVSFVGMNSVDACCIMPGVNEFIQNWSAESPCPYERGVIAERECIECIEMCMTAIEASGESSLGWDDVLGGIASQHEEHIYLLEQRIQ